MRIRVDRLRSEWGSRPRASVPCPGAVRCQSFQNGHLDAWWEVEIDDLDAFLDLLRRCEGRSAVVEISETNNSQPEVRIWIVEDTWLREVRSSGRRTPGT